MFVGRHRLFGGIVRYGVFAYRPKVRRSRRSPITGEHLPAHASPEGYAATPLADSRQPPILSPGYFREA